MEKIAAAKRVILHAYEKVFLDRLALEEHKDVANIEFADEMRLLIRTTARKLRGYDLDETRKYYRYMVEHKFLDARQTVDADKLDVKLDQDLEWVMMHEDQADVLNREGYYYEPHWHRHYHYPRGRRSLPPVTPEPGAAVPDIGTSFADVKDTFASWLQNTTDGLGGADGPGSLQSLGGKGGVVDLSGVDQATSDFFKSMGESSGGGGGFGGGCACAGCACACACAGGGR